VSAVGVDRAGEDSPEELSPQPARPSVPVPASARRNLRRFTLVLTVER
ncbi:MAG: hypothetical protein ACI8XM_000340, partial [Haloarculaceae archaeon]